jgi:threonine dehydrogenase-like Zn-dependent dehydrogenase
MNRSLTLRTGQCHAQKYMKPLLDLIEQDKVDPTRVITHQLPLTKAPTP